MNQPSFKDRFRYWFDNRMSKGSIELIRILLIFTILVILFLTGIILIFKLNGETGAVGVIWQSLATIINAWMPDYDSEMSLGYLVILAFAAFIGLLVTSVLIGIITSAMEEKIMNLRKGNSPVIEEGHIIVLGFYPGEYTLIRQLILASGKRPCTIVIGGELDRDEIEQYILDNIEKPKNVKIICRTIDMFDPVSIEKLSPQTCRTMIISPTDDNSTIKTLLAVSAIIQNVVKRKIRVNAIISKEEKRFPPMMARKHNVITLQTNETLAKIIAHSCTQTGLSEVFREIFNFEGSELYLIDLQEKEGLTFIELMSRVNCAIPIGIYREHNIIMRPDPEEVIKATDKLFVFAEEKDSAILTSAEEHQSRIYQSKKVDAEKNTKILVFGQNSSLKTVLQELPENVREVILVNYDDSQMEKIRKICESRQIILTLSQGNTRDEMELLHLARNIEHIIVLSDYDKEEDDADMDTTFLLLNLRELRMKYHLRFNITAEMRREKNQNLVTDDDHTDFVVASNMGSLFLAQLAESPALIEAFREILSNEGNEIYMKSPKNMSLTGLYSVCEIRQRLYALGYIFLGYMKSDNTYQFNPPLDANIEIKGSDKLIVLGEE